MSTLSLTIQGMSCDHCVARVKQALGKLAGVRIERVEVGLATVSYDAAQVTPESIRQAVEDLGYEVPSAEEAA
jgi:copper chaperone